MHHAIGVQKVCEVHGRSDMMLCLLLGTGHTANKLCWFGRKPLQSGKAANMGADGECDMCHHDAICTASAKCQSTNRLLRPMVLAHVWCESESHQIQTQSFWQAPHLIVTHAPATLVVWCACMWAHAIMQSLTPPTCPQLTSWLTPKGGTTRQIGQ